MPTLGYICGGTIRQYIEAVSKYVALFLLCIIGINMIRENLKGECKETNRALGFTVMPPLQSILLLSAVPAPFRSNGLSFLTVLHAFPFLQSVPDSAQ